MSENRDETTGQFAPAPDPILTGKEGIEQAAGYVPLQNEAKANEPDDTSPISVEEASLDLTTSREAGTPESEIRSYGTFLDNLDPNVSITPEQAAEITTREKAAEAKAAEEAQLQRVRDEVDLKRGIEAEKALPADVRAMIETGVDEDVAIALTKPQVRQAVEQEFARADQVRESYTAGLEQARIASLATLAEVVPHLAGLDPSRFEEGLAVLQQVDPPAFQQAMNVLQRTHQIVAAQQAAQQQQQQVQYQQFEQHTRSEDVRLVQMVGKEKADEANQAVINYLDQHGVPKNQRLSMIMQNPVLRSAEARDTIWKAAKYDQIMKSTPKAAPKGLPPVQKPGTSNQVRATSDTGKLASLEKALSSASGDKAARISAQIHAIERRARG
jgi:hypothetical protein